MTDLSQLPQSASPCESSRKLERGRTVKWQRKTIRIVWRCISPVMQEPPNDLVCRASVSQNNTSDPRLTPLRPPTKARSGCCIRRGAREARSCSLFRAKRILNARFAQIPARVRSAGKRASPFSAGQSSGLMLTCRLCPRVFDPSFRKRHPGAPCPVSPPMAGAYTY